MLQTEYGEISGVVCAGYYADGSLYECRLNRKNVLHLSCGDLIPQYGEEDVRRKFIKSLSFYENRKIKSVALEAQTEIITPIGKFPAELVTFYESGEVKRVFPLNGKISGYWSEQDEKKLSFPFCFRFDFGMFSARVIGLHFYKSGRLKTLTLFPGEVIRLSTPAGEIPVRTGFSLYENGRIKSVEPAEPVCVTTKIGALTAFDENALGINADKNSLVFDEAGNPVSLFSFSDRITAVTEDGETDRLAPVRRRFGPDENAFITIPLKFEFFGGLLKITGEDEHVYPLDRTRFDITGTPRGMSECAPGGCASCALCR